MAMSVTYTTFCGQIVHENRGGTEHYYVSDTLGSTAALLDSSGNLTDTFEYWPYGEVRTRTGSTATPFQFVGTLGYYVDATKRVYVRARYLATNYARWLTVDPLWPLRAQYTYVNNQPNNFIDPSGLLDYKVGDSDPLILVDPGAGAWDSESLTARALGFRKLLIGILPAAYAIYPNAAKNLAHYLDNVGTDLDQDIENLYKSSLTFQEVYMKELREAREFCMSLPYGSQNVHITSKHARPGYITKSESKDWFYAVGGFHAWGKGICSVCSSPRRKYAYYTPEFTLKFYDRYNWDKGKSTTIGGVTITDYEMGELHREGLAMEFDSVGSKSHIYKWWL